MKIPAKRLPAGVTTHHPKSPAPWVEVSPVLFHWSPTERRKQIVRYGLRPRMWSTDRLWRPPFVCFSGSPSLAWQMSGATPRGREVDEWDLWQAWTDDLDRYEILFDHRDRTVKEIRVYHRVYKRDLWYVGSRTVGGSRG